MRQAVFVVFACLAVTACDQSEKPATPAASSKGESAARRTIGAFWRLESHRMEAAFERRRARENAFQLATYSSRLGGTTYLGVVCSNPRMTQALPLGGGRGFGLDDALHTDAAVRRAESAGASAERTAAGAHNLRVIHRADFPYPDLCGAEGAPLSVAGDMADGRRPLRKVAGSARDLHDAARRGSVDEVRSWLARSDNVDAPDAFGLTPLAWAVQRDRPEIIDLLLDEGASPVAGLGDPGEHSALWFAARNGDDAMLDRLTRFPGRAKRVSVPEWPRSVIEAALLGGSESMLFKISVQRHEAVDRADIVRWTETYPFAANQLRRLAVKR